MRPRGPQAFDEFAEQYDTAISLERSHDFFLKNLPVRRDSVLEVGCGTGLLAYELSHRFGAVVALDVSEAMLAIARKKRSRANIEYRQADADDLALPARYDAVVSHTTFHHLADIPKTVSGLTGALFPGGRLILVDCITRFAPLIPRWSLFHRAFSGVRLPSDCARIGFDAAWTLFRFRTSRPWIAHVQSDRYLTREQFCALYGRLLPGAQFTRMGSLMGCVWTAAFANRTREEPNSVHSGSR